MNILILLFKFAGNVGYTVINLFQFNSIVNSAKKHGARGNCPVCPLLNPALGPLLSTAQSDRRWENNYSCLFPFSSCLISATTSFLGAKSLVIIQN